jgi:hypothetical protein
MLFDKEKSLLPRFILAKTIDFGEQARLRRQYRRNLELAAIISIILAIILTKWSPNWKMVRKEAYVEVEGFEVVEMPLVEETPPPLPPLTEPMSADQLIVDEIQIIKEEEKEPEPEPTLDLNLEIDTKVVMESSLDSDFRTKIDNYRGLKLGDSKLALGDDYRSHATETSSLDLGIKKNDSQRRETEKVDLKLETKADLPESVPQNPEVADGSLIEATEDVDVVILKPPKSTLALTEYQMWSKLSGEFDRMDKRHLADDLPNLKKNDNGIQVAFRYQDGITHQIFWQKGGKTSIKVIGKNRKTTLEELQRALSALLQLTINHY